MWNALILRPNLELGSKRRALVFPTGMRKAVSMTWIPKAPSGDSAKQLQGPEGEGDSNSSARTEKELVKD